MGPLVPTGAAHRAIQPLAEKYLPNIFESIFFLLFGTAAALAVGRAEAWGRGVAPSVLFIAASRACVRGEGEGGGLGLLGIRQRWQLPGLFPFAVLGGEEELMLVPDFPNTLVCQ